MAKNFGWLLFDRLFRISISVVVGAWIARHLGPANYGELAYILALLGLFQTAATLGLDGPVIRLVSRDVSEAGLVFGTAIRLRVAASALGWLFATITVAVARPGDTPGLLMVAIAGAALVFQPAEMVDVWLQSQNRSRLSIPYRLAAYTLIATYKVGLILSEAPLWAFAASAVIDAIFVAGALSVAYRLWPTPSVWRWHSALVRDLLTECWPLMISAVSISVYMRIDQIMLRELAGQVQLGLYSAVMPISQGWHMVPMLLYASLLPRLSQLHAEYPERYRARLQSVYTTLTWGGICAAAITSICAPWLIATLLGPRFHDAVPVLQWHAVTNIFVFMGIAQNLSIVAEKMPKLIMLKTFVGVVVSLVANYMLIPQWGAVGSAWAAVISYGSSVVLSNIFLAPNALRMQMLAFVPGYEKRH